MAILGPGPYTFTTEKLKLGETSPYPRSQERRTKFLINGIEVDSTTYYKLKRNPNYKRKLKIGELPGVEKRSIELLNKGLPVNEVANILEKEKLIKLNSYPDAQTGKLIKSYDPMRKYFNKLLKDGKLNVEKFPKVDSTSGLTLDEIQKRNKKVLKIINRNLDLNPNQLSKIANVSANVINKVAKDANINLTTKPQVIFKELKILDKLIKDNQKLLGTDTTTIADKNKFLIDKFKNKLGKDFSLENYFYRLKRLGNLYAGQKSESLATADLYNKIKPPKNYMDSNLHKNLIGMVSRDFTSVVDKAKLLGLPKKDINLLDDVLKGASALTKMKIAGDHTDIDALMKNFKDYKKNFTRINIISDKLNTEKLGADNRIIKLTNDFKIGAIDKDKFTEEINKVRTEFTNKTKVPIGNPVVKDGKITLDFQTERLIDLENPRNTAINQALNNLVEQSGVKVSEFDSKLSKITNAKDRANFLKNANPNDLKKSKILQALSRMPGIGKIAATLIGGGTIGAVGFTTLANAAGPNDNEDISPEVMVGGGAAAALATGLGIKYNKEIGAFVTGNEDIASQSDIKKYAADNPMEVKVGEEPVKAATNKSVLANVGKAMARVGAPLPTAILDSYFIGQQVKEGKGTAEIASNPLNWLGLATMEPLSKAAGIDKGGALNKALRLGLNPATIRGISRFAGLPGLAISTAMTAYDQYQKYKDGEGFIFNLLNQKGTE